MIDAPSGGELESYPCVIYHGEATPDAFASSPDEPLHWRPAAELLSRRSGVHAAVLIADASMLDHTGVIRGVPSHVLVIANDRATEEALGPHAQLSVAEFRDAASRGRVLRGACHLACERLIALRRRRLLGRTNRELRELSDIGMALMDKHDRAALLHDILDLGKQLTDSDGAALLLVEHPKGQAPHLRPVAYEFNSVPNLPKSDLVYSIDQTSIVGHAAVIKQPVVIDDAYELPRGVDFERNSVFDETFGYRTRSLLVVPMVDQRGLVVGVLVLVNRVSDLSAKITSKEAADRYVLPYKGREVRVARSLASQAAMAIENVHLYAQIERTLESFVKAAVTAVDARDPSTAGHSLRVAALTENLAKAVEREGRGPYRDFHFTEAQLKELRFAALLHDFGKLSVHEEVLTKAKKLPPALGERVNGRFDLIRRTMEVDHYKGLVESKTTDPREVARREKKLAADVEQLEHLRAVVRDANEPSVVEAPPVTTLHEIAQRTFHGCDGAVIPFLTAEELHYLELSQGTLDHHERAEVESHVDETFRFLDQIPWTEDLRNLASYAYGHHEKLNGSGYPRRLKGDAIPIQTRLITLADMFDALTAADRPYKPAVTPQRALEIIVADAKAGLLDRELVRVMVESQAYRKVLEEDWHRF